MKLGEYFCLFLNNFFPKIKMPGRESPQSYSEAQYGWAEDDLRLYAPYINLKDKIVLDAGCGPGGKTVFYAQNGCKLIIGIDMDENHIRYAKEFAKKKRISNAEFKVGNLNALPFESNKFDIIFMNDVVEHIRRPILVNASIPRGRSVSSPPGSSVMENPFMLIFLRSSPLAFASTFSPLSERSVRHTPSDKLR